MSSENRTSNGEWYEWRTDLLISSIRDTLSHREISESDWGMLEESYQEIRQGK